MFMNLATSKEDGWEAAEKQNPGWAKPQILELYLLFVVGLMVEIGSEKLNRVRRRG